MSAPNDEFSFRTREESLRRFRTETFDLLVIGGGITGASVARDAVARGLSVAVVEKDDFSSGTSSRSSKLIHGGLRYLENLEFSLVFEALSERALLLKTAPHLVRPLPFYFPVFQKDPRGMLTLSMGLWFYDLLALFRAPGFHQRLKRTELLRDIPFLRGEELLGGFRYYDASMWDDAMVVEILRSAHQHGAAVANYVEAVTPYWNQERIRGFYVRNTLATGGVDEILIRAKRVVVCAGPWTDQLGERISAQWKPWLTPSKGVHLVFDLKRIPVPGALVMSHPVDRRVSFVIPRPDLGGGVVIVGTTDGPAPRNPDQPEVLKDEVNYLVDLLQRYFPTLEITAKDIISAYVGIRPLVGTSQSQLQSVSREHHIDTGPGGVVVVAGGKYTTHRTMAQEIVDFVLKTWRRDVGMDAPPRVHQVFSTKDAVNPSALTDHIRRARMDAEASGWKIPEILWDRYGADAVQICRLDQEHPHPTQSTDPDGFPMIEAQLRYSVRYQMTMHLDDFVFRRTPLFLSRQDHGEPWYDALARAWAEERNFSPVEVNHQIGRVAAEVHRRDSWRSALNQIS